MSATTNRVSNTAGAASPVSTPRSHNTLGEWALRVAPLVTFGVLLLLWYLLSLSYPPFILPGPQLVAERLVQKLADGTLLVHTAVTLSEALPGLVIGALFGFAVGYPIAKSHVMDRLLSPFIVASQGVPFIAIAPLLLIWFGNGAGAKIFLCAIVVFFPITVNVIVGLRGISPLLRDLFRSMSASRWETFTRLELPAALPLVLAGLRVGGTLSMIGALAAEFLGTDRGLGFLINQGRGVYDTPLVMVGIVTTVATALCIYGSIRYIERKVVK